MEKKEFIERYNNGETLVLLIAEHPTLFSKNMQEQKHEINFDKQCIMLTISTSFGNEYVGGKFIDVYTINEYIYILLKQLRLSQLHSTLLAQLWAICSKEETPEIHYEDVNKMYSELPNLKQMATQMLLTTTRDYIDKEYGE